MNGNKQTTKRQFLEPPVLHNFMKNLPRYNEFLMPDILGSKEDNSEQLKISYIAYSESLLLKRLCQSGENKTCFIFSRKEQEQERKEQSKYQVLGIHPEAQQKRWLLKPCGQMEAPFQVTVCILHLKCTLMRSNYSYL